MCQRPRLLLFLGLITLVSCRPSDADTDYTFPITDLTSAQYPDDPDLGYRHSAYDDGYLTQGRISQEANGQFSFRFYAGERNRDSVVVRHLDLMEFMPSVPKQLKNDAYLSYLAVVNQEWNRNQVQFDSSQFQASAAGITRVDIARNCLNAYLWEVLLFKKENGQEVPFSHGWFTFPKPLYARLFTTRNDVDFARYQAPLENWIDPASKVVSTASFARIQDTVQVSFSDLSEGMYPVKGAFKRKYKEIIRPGTFAGMRDLQTDSTQFATFSPPGIYVKADPRKTELGRLNTLQTIALYRTDGPSASDPRYQIDFTFQDAHQSRTTKLRLGGLDFATLPVLADSNATEGWKNSMGFANHPFYERYRQHEAWHANDNPYFAYFTDGDNRWLDSHKIGVDGPVLYRDVANPNRIHVWLLSFERHALVGHYVLTIRS